MVKPVSQLFSSIQNNVYMVYLSGLKYAWSFITSAVEYERSSHMNASWPFFLRGGGGGQLIESSLNKEATKGGKEDCCIWNEWETMLNGAARACARAWWTKLRSAVHHDVANLNQGGRQGGWCVYKSCCSPEMRRQSIRNSGHQINVKQRQRQSLI